MNDAHIYELRYGYSREGEPLSEHIRYNRQLVEVYHPWSDRAVGEVFGSREYSKLIPLMDYLTAPVDLIENILEGVARGEEQAAELKSQAVKRAQDAAVRAAKNGDGAVDNLIKEGMKHVK